MLTKFEIDENVKIERLKGTDKYVLKKRTVTVDFLVDNFFRRFKTREYEGIRFDFGDGVQHRCPEENEVRNAILQAMEKSAISSDGLTLENKKEMELFFNSFLPAGKKKREIVNVTGDVVPTSTHNLERRSVRVGELERDSTAFMSEEYVEEVDEKTKVMLGHLRDTRTPNTQQPSFSFIDQTGLLETHREYVRSLIENDDRPPYLVNPSVFKTAQSTILVSHHPEKEFVFRLLKHAN